MEYKTVKIKKYHYCCKFCGNKFTKEYEVDPYKCRVCGEHECFICDEIMHEVIKQMCPICNHFFRTSDFLNNEIHDEHVRWLANMVTHYRHVHLKSWDKMWGHNGHYYRHGWYDGDYESHKKDVNERAKRQILRKCKKYMIDNGFSTEHVMQLQNTDEKTIELYDKLLKSNKMASVE